MAGGNFYCLIAGLPEMAPDEKKLTLSVHDIRSYFHDYLSDKEMEVVNLFFLPNDNAQILNILQKKAPDSELETVFDIEQLESEVQDPMFLPSYLKQFVLEWQEQEETERQRLPETELSERYWEFMCSQKNSFVRRYAEFSMQIKNFITALNCRKYGLPIENEVIGTSEFSEKLRTSKAKDFELSSDYPFVDTILTLFENANIAEREYQIDLLFWNFLDEQTTFKYFTFDNVLAFMLKLMIVERWSKMSGEQGRSIFESLLQRFKSEFSFAKEFEI